METRAHARVVPVAGGQGPGGVPMPRVILVTSFGTRPDRGPSLAGGAIEEGVEGVPIPRQGPF